jgi:hypothetical protein
LRRTFGWLSDAALPALVHVVSYMKSELLWSAAAVEGINVGEALSGVLIYIPPS